MYDNKYVFFFYFGFIKFCVYSIVFYLASIDSFLRILLKGGYVFFIKYCFLFVRYVLSIVFLLLFDGGICVLFYFNFFAFKYSRCVSTMTFRFVVCENEFVCFLWLNLYVVKNLFVVLWYVVYVLFLLLCRSLCCVLSMVLVLVL